MSTNLSQLQSLVQQPAARAFFKGLFARARLEARMYRSTELTLSAGTALALWYGALEVHAGRLSVGDLVLVMSYLSSLYRPLRRISRSVERAGKAASCLDRITDLLDTKPEVQDLSLIHIFIT